MRDETFQMMIDQRETIQNVVDEIAAPVVERIRADNDCTLTRFVDIVASLVTKAMRLSNVQFMPDEGMRPINDPTEKLENPRITYKVIDRVPKENKPRIRQVVNEQSEDASKRFVTLYGQRFACKIQFNIFATEYSSANKVMSELEDLLIKYSGYIKQQGVAELFFIRHFTDQDLDAFRQDMSVRSLQYYVETERVIAEFNGEITDITIT